MRYSVTLVSWWAWPLLERPRPRVQATRALMRMLKSPMGDFGVTGSPALTLATTGNHLFPTYVSISPPKKTHLITVISPHRVIYNIRLHIQRIETLRRKNKAWEDGGRRGCRCLRCVYVASS